MTSSPEDSPASRSASQGPDSPRTTPDGSGPNSLESFAWYDPDTSSWKTSQGSLLPEWATYSGTWPKSGTTQNGQASPRPLLVPRTYGGDSSSWPTPQAKESLPQGAFVDEMREAGANPDERLYLPGRKWHTQRTLSRMVQLKPGQKDRWPTPTTADTRPGSANQDRSHLRDEVLWPTPKASPSGPDYARAGREDSGGDDLVTAVARYSTPTASNRDSAGGSNSRRTEKEAGTYISGQLNPTWVEWLMGFPLGWTDLEASATL